jgi:D-glycero-D-manno-heptose 1,7-bisphosphate phosphatase
VNVKFHVEQAVILAGGRGTRLGVLTNQVPKPMLPIGGKPFLEYLLIQLKGRGIQRILLCVGYLAEQLQDHFGDGRQLGLEIKYNLETEPAGTGGPLFLARAALADQFFVLNGDTIFDIPFQSLAETLHAQPEALGAIALRRVDDVGRYGCVGLAGEWVSRFDEKSRGGPGYINGGIYCLRKPVIDLLPPPPCSVERTLFPLLAERRRLLGRCFEAYFTDIGLPESLRQAKTELPERFGGLKPIRNPP